MSLTKSCYTAAVYYATQGCPNMVSTQRATAATLYKGVKKQTRAGTGAKGTLAVLLSGGEPSALAFWNSCRGLNHDTVG